MALSGGGEEEASCGSSTTTTTTTSDGDEVMSMASKTHLLAKLLLSPDSDPPCIKKKKVNRKVKTASVNVLPPCRVCGHPASGFHYGVNACEACKRFFRRATRRKRSFKCRGVKRCNVRGPTRTSCGYCRYDRCLAQGMSSTNSKTGRYSHQKRAQDITEVQQLHMRSLDALRITEAEVDAVVQTLISGQRSMRTNEAIPTEVIRARLKKKHEEFTFLQTLIGPHRLISHEEYADVYEQTGLDVDGRKRRVETWMNSIENCIEGFVTFCKSIPGFRQLSVHDQTRLLKTSRVEVWFLGAFRGFHADLQSIHAPNGNCHHSFEMAQFLGRDYVDCAFQLADRLRGLNATPEENVVIKAMCVMSVDRGHLDDPKVVEEKQWVLVKCLLHLIEKNEEREPGMFSRVISSIMALRTLSDISRRYLTTTLIADAIKTHPMLFELLLG